VLTLIIGARGFSSQSPRVRLYGAMPRVFLQYTTPFSEPAARAALTLCSRVPSVSTTRAFGRLTVRSRGLGILCLHPRQVSQEHTCHVVPIHSGARPFQ